ncbi:MAG: zinc-ribbon domain-containing protein [Finegoldia magna]|nr:zinc-ribbon domain-containing protein [Finegoldia magna]
MRCPNCNEKVLDTVNFCHNCGFNLKEYRENLN